MRIDRLRIQNLRCFTTIELTPGPRLNWLIGGNGAGKTTLLEAVYLLSHGHSFRQGALETLIQHDRANFLLYAEIGGRRENACVLGMGRSAGTWQLRVNGVDRSTLGPFLEKCAAVCFEPGSHALIAGAAEGRRRFLDWGVFHVEHAFLEQWRHYRRALRQRNALLRSGGPGEQFAIWEAELERFARPVERARMNYVEAFEPLLREVANRLLPELGATTMHYHSGWNQGRALQDVLSAQRSLDLLHGYTRSGSHRADWGLSFTEAPDRAYLSRGQTKLVALSCVLAQAALFAQTVGEWPILGMDELASELDVDHQNRVFEYIREQQVQVLITATQPPPDEFKSGLAAVFHVEHGIVRPV